MSYLAIARKYRPATFDEIVGQEHVTRTLRNAIARDRVHHAFLFTGARGVGKTTAARALAKSLNCAEGPSDQPCGACTSCTEVSQGSSPDLIEIDGASNNSVDDIRDLRDTVQYAPTGGGYKVYLIDEVHMLSKGAFNALLKTLEEPPSHVVFVFATTEPHRIPDTILSRVQRFDFKRIAAGAVAERLRAIAEREGATLSDHALRLIARAGEGSMRDAQSLLDQVLSFSGSEVSDAEVAETLGLIDTRLVHDMLGGMLEGNPTRCFEVIDQVYGYGYELSQFTAELLETIRNLTLLVLSPDSQRFVDLPEEERAELLQLGEGVAPEGLGRLFQAMLDTHDEVSRASRPRVVLEMAMARLATTRPVHPVGQLVGRLEELERMLRTGGGGGAPSGGGLRPRGRHSTRNRVPPMQLASAVIAEKTREAEAVQARAPAPSTSPMPPARPVPAGTPSAPDMPPAPPLEERVPLAVEDLAPEVAFDSEQADPKAQWEALCKAFAAHESTRILAEATPLFAGGVLELTFSEARKAGSAGRALDEPRALAAVRACYGPEVRPQVIWQSGRASDNRDNLRRRALSDPDLQRVLKAFDGTLRDVRPLDEGDDT